MAFLGWEKWSRLPSCGVLGRLHRLSREPAGTGARHAWADYERRPPGFCAPHPCRCSTPSTGSPHTPDPTAGGRGHLRTASRTAAPPPPDQATSACAQVGSGRHARKAKGPRTARCGLCQSDLVLPTVGTSGRHAAGTAAYAASSFRVTAMPGILPYRRRPTPDVSVVPRLPVTPLQVPAHHY